MPIRHDAIGVRRLTYLKSSISPVPSLASTKGVPSTQSRILITGSNGAFDRLAALKLARNGHHVIATMRNLSKGKDLIEAGKAQGLSLETRPLDVCDSDSVAQASPTPRRSMCS